MDYESSAIRRLSNDTIASNFTSLNVMSTVLLYLVLQLVKAQEQTAVVVSLSRMA